MNLGDLFNFSNLFSEVLVMQTAIIINMLVLFLLRNIFYTLLYFLLFTLQLGVFISFYQMELFTGFLYVIEITAIFIMLLVLFYLNFKSHATYYSISDLSVQLVLIFILLLVPSFYTEGELFLPPLFNFTSLWDNFYDGLCGYSLNDFIGLYLSYFLLNSLELVIIGFILFAGSILCVVLFNLSGFSKNSNYSLLKNFINFFFNLLDFYFLRKQNLIKQNLQQPGLRILKNRSKI